MVNVVKQLAEKTIEHDTVQYSIFVDFHKVYDSVSREALGTPLLELGVLEGW